MTVRIVSAPSNLGVRPPERTAVPGTGKAPEAFRQAGLYERLAAAGVVDDGVVLSGRYLDDVDPVSSTVRNEAKIIDHARRLAERLGYVGADDQQLILGGDCSILLGVGLACRRRGRFALVHIDGHTDYRQHPSEPGWGAVAGEDLAAVTGAHLPTLSNIDGIGPYFHPSEAVHIGCRTNDSHLEEVRDVMAECITSQAWVADPARARDSVRRVIRRNDLDGYWVHLDVDVLDPVHMPAVDSPDPGGVTPEVLSDLLSALWPRAAGMNVCVFDPDLDPTGEYVELLVDMLAETIG